MKIANETQSKIRTTPDYDAAWKEVIEEHFDPFPVDIHRFNLPITGRS